MNEQIRPDEIHTKPLPWPLLFLALVSFAIALTAFYFHAIVLNPQSDTQVIFYSFEFVDALKNGTLAEYFLTVRKYPFFYTLTYTVPYKLITTVVNSFTSGTISPLLSAHVIGRLLSLVCALGTLALVGKISKSMRYSYSAVLLLLTSILFFTFSTAIRPHVIVAFWAVLSLFFSIRLSSNKTIPNTILAFATALAAFSTLQNGIFAFIFPIWGYLSHGWKDWKVWVKCGAWTAGFLALSLLTGYTFLLKSLTGEAVGDVSLDLGHNAGNVWNGAGFKAVFRTLIGNELVLLFFAIWSLVLFLRKKDQLPRAMVPVLLFVLAYCTIFGVYGGGTKERYFVMAMPFFALAGAGALSAAPRTVKIGLLVFIVVMYSKFAYLGFLQNTYQAASQYLRTTTTGPIATDLPPYWLDIPADRYKFETENDVRFILSIKGKHDLPSPWQPCFKANSSRYDADMFLWKAVHWGFIRLFEARALGPNLTVYCKG